MYYTKEYILFPWQMQYSRIYLTQLYCIYWEGRWNNLKFYNVKTRESVEVADANVSVITMKNGKKAAKAEHNGTKLFKILSREDAARLSA